MADLLIRGMKMPTDEPLRLVLNQNGQLFVDHGVTFTEYEAVELPEHGDLIDRDAMYELVKQRGKNWAGEWCDFECHISGNDIKNAPVIVPSNKERSADA